MLKLKDNCFRGKERKILLFMFAQCLIISILPCKGLFRLVINGKSLRNMEEVPRDTNDAICKRTS